MNDPHLLLPVVRVGVDVVVVPSLNDLLGLLPREQELPDDTHRPVEEVAVAAVLPSPCRVPVLRQG